MTDVARASLTNLVRRVLERTNTSVSTRGTMAGGSIRHAYVPAMEKRHILDLIWESAGPGAILAVGRGIRDAGYDPIWEAALRAPSPARLYAGWRRLENYGHSTNRVRIIELSETRTAFERYTVDTDAAPSVPENLLICGLIIALLEAIGCQGLTCRMPDANNRVVAIYGERQFVDSAFSGQMNTGYWEISWDRFEAPAHEPRAPESDLPLPIPDTCFGATRKAVNRAILLMFDDLLRQWKVAEIAREIGMSTRTFQRRLTEAGLSFSNLVRAVRVHEACRLLNNGDISITAAGFCAGFCDSAHFSRDFRASTGMTPSTYRSAVLQ